MVNMKVFISRVTCWRYAQIKKAAIFFLICFGILTDLAADELTQSDISVKQHHTQPHFWQSQNSDSSLLLDTSEIKEFNHQLYYKDSPVSNPLTLPNTLSRITLVKLVNTISKIPKSDRYYSNGTKLTQHDYNQFIENIDYKRLNEVNSISYGLIVKRSSLRTFPTDKRVFTSELDLELDRFQESAVFPGEPVAILMQSQDKKWLLVRNYHYIAWVKTEDVAISTFSEVSDFINSEQFLLVTGAKVFSYLENSGGEISKVQLDMGVKLPLIAKSNIPKLLNGQSTDDKYIVKFPSVSSTGKLAFTLVAISKTADVHIGYLKLTKANLIAQAMKFYGERYGWGHDFNARDCTGFISEIYKSFGILMPRNSGQQGKGEYGVNFRFDNKTNKIQKDKDINDLKVGDLIYITGHVMMYLGEDQGIKYVIHDVKDVGYFDKQNIFNKMHINAVTISPLNSLYLTEKLSYVNDIYNIKRIKLKE